MAKVKFFQLDNLVVGLKALGSSIVSMILLALLYMLQQFVASKGLMAVSYVIGIFGLVAHLLVFGWLSRMWWKWK